MSNLVRTGMMLAGLLVPTAGWAECSVSADPGAVVRSVSPAVPADADLIVSMSMMPKLTRLDYKAAAKRPSCDLGPIAAAGDSYELWGSDTPGRTRRALPAGKSGPIALVVPIFDILKALEGSKTGKRPATEGYLLAVVTTTDFTGWRLYTAMPDVATLKRDMAEVLAGDGTPIFRNGADGKTTLFVTGR